MRPPEIAGPPIPLPSGVSHSARNPSAGNFRTSPDSLVVELCAGPSMRGQSASAAKVRAMHNTASPNRGKIFIFILPPPSCAAPSLLRDRQRPARAEFLDHRLLGPEFEHL